MKRREKFWFSMSVMLLVVLLAVVVCTSSNYDDCLGVFDEQEEVIESYKQHNAEMNAEWYARYEELEEKYVKALAEIDQLKQGGFTYSEVMELCACVEAEAGSYLSDEVQRNVAQVIVNRMNSTQFPDTLHEVIFENHDNVPQFSVAYNGSMSEVSVTGKTMYNVHEVLENGGELPDYVMYFYSTSVKNNWVNTLSTYCEVDGVIFAYKEEDKHE